MSWKQSKDKKQALSHQTMASHMFCITVQALRLNGSCKPTMASVFYRFKEGNCHGQFLQQLRKKKRYKFFFFFPIWWLSVRNRKINSSCVSYIAIKLLTLLVSWLSISQAKCKAMYKRTRKPPLSIAKNSLQCEF